MDLVQSKEKRVSETEDFRKFKKSKPCILVLSPRVTTANVKCIFSYIHINQNKTRSRIIKENIIANIPILPRA